MALSKTTRNTLILLLVFALLGLAAGSINETEARLLWAIHDPGPAPDGIGETLRFARDSLTRAYERGGPGALIFDAWALLAGPSAASARILPRLAALLIVAVGLARRWWLAIFLAVPFAFFTAQAGLPLLYLNTPDWNAAARQIVDQRDPREPLLFTFQPDDPLGYYDRRYGIRQGITLDLGWRDHDSTEITGYIERLAGAESVWMVMPDGSPVTAAVQNALDANGYACTRINDIDRVFIARCDRRAP